MRALIFLVLGMASLAAQEIERKLVDVRTSPSANSPAV